MKWMGLAPVAMPMMAQQANQTTFGYGGKVFGGSGVMDAIKNVEVSDWRPSRIARLTKLLKSGLGYDYENENEVFNRQMQKRHERVSVHASSLRSVSQQHRHRMEMDSYRQLNEEIARREWKQELDNLLNPFKGEL